MLSCRHPLRRTRLCVPTLLLGALFMWVATPTSPAWGGGAPATFVRGDVNDDTNLNLTDVLVMLNYLFAGGIEPGCLDSADLNDDGSVALPDALYLLNYLFVAGTAPLPPFPGAGSDLTPDTLICCVVPVDLEAQVIASFPISACVPQSTQSGATICATPGGVCGPVAGCDFVVNLGTLNYDIVTGVIDATGTITSDDFDVDAGIFGSCNGTLTMDYTATVLLTTTTLPNGQLEVTAVDSMFDVSNITVGNCGGLGTILNLLSSSLESTIEDQATATAGPILDLIVGNRICAP